MTLFVAQAFTPGNQREVSFKSPINGALVAHPVSDPGVNAWATENPTMKLDHRHKYPTTYVFSPFLRYIC